MSSTKCVTCGKSFFSPFGSNKCNTCAKKDGSGMDQGGHHSCGCGGHHH